MRRPPAGIRHRAGRLEPVLALSKLVGQGHNGGVLDVVEARFGRHQPRRLVAGGDTIADVVAARRTLGKNIAGEPG